MTTSPSTSTSTPAAAPAPGTRLSANVGRHPGEMNVMEPSLLADPVAGYGALREQGPLVRGRFIDDTPVWFVTRFDDVRTALRDPQFVNSPASVPGYADPDPRLRTVEMLGFPPHLTQYLLGSILDSDPPKHTRLRRLVSRAFTARRILALRPRVERITADLLDALPGHADESGAVDLIEHFAYPLPITVICDLVGIPEADRPLWRRWSTDLVTLTPDALGTSFPEVIAYIQELVRLRRAEPADDLLSALIRAQDEDGGKLSDTELVTMVITLVVAGHETTAHLIGNGTAALLTHPDQLALLREDPGLFPRAVHELMRWCGPVQLTQLRYASKDTELGGVPVKKGEALQISLVAANFDPRHYTDPLRLDLTRHTEGQAEDHVGFGHGMHYCLGATLARQEGEVALGALLDRYPDLAPAVAPHELERVPLPGSWRLARLPLRLGTPAA